MKTLLKVTALILLLAITFISIGNVEGRAQSKVIIEGVGQPTAARAPNGDIYWKCDDTTSNKCTITIVFQE